jgi:hypothetical protein
MSSITADLYAVENYYNTSGFAWSRIQEQYSAHPITTTLVTTAFDNVAADAGDGVFEVNGKIDLRMPQSFYYTPGVAYVLKQGWVQYFSLLVLVAGVLYPLYSVVVVNGLVSTFTSVDGGINANGRKMKMY